MGRLGRVADRIVPKNSTRGLNIQKSFVFAGIFFVTAHPFFKADGIRG